LSYHDILNIIIFNRNSIIKITGIGIVFILLILILIYPVTYKSTVTVLPPDKNNEMTGLSTLLGAQDFSGLLTAGTGNANSQLYQQILESRTASVFVVKKLGLTNYFNTDNIYKAAGKLENHIAVEVTKEGLIKLTSDLSTPFFPVFANKDTVRNLAARISNSFIEGLDKINREKLSSKAKKARIYIEGQILKTKTILDSVENRLMDFQKTNKAVSLPEQVNAAIDAAAKLKAEIMKTEVELGLLEPNLREDNKSLLALKNKLNNLQEQYNKMEMGSQDYLVAFREVPELGKQLANLLREVKIQNEVYTMLQQQYYKEKIQENKDLPTVEILDEAIPPLTSSSPRIVFVAILGGIFLFLCASLIFIIKDRNIYLIRNKNNKKEENV
jgi:tyrosine-protein kinase Etk/Wzc